MPDALSRATTFALVAGQVLLGIPVSAAVPQKTPPKGPPTVAVNRTVPKVTAPPTLPHFSASPTEGELFRARVFSEPLVPVGAAPTREANAAVARALESYVEAGASDHTAPLEAFLADHPTSPWRASLLLGLGQVYARAGRLSRAVRAFSEAWEGARGETEPKAKAVADLAVGELARLLARLGHVTELQRLLAEVEGRPVAGTAAELLQQGREGVRMMEIQPESSFRCGPLALDRMLGYGRPGYRTDPRLASYPSSPHGTTLAEIHALGRELGLSYEMAKRVDRSAGVLLPAVVHLEVGHFAAVVEEHGGRYLVNDPVLGEELWMSREALDDEASGYALVPAGKLPWGWRAASAEEARHVWGRGNVTGHDDTRYRPEDDKRGGNACNCSGGMAEYTVHSMLVSLNVADTPLRYTPPRGPAVSLTVTYNQREAFQPQTFSYWNLGSRWTTDWMGYVEDDPGNGAQPAAVYRRGGGKETSTGFSAATGAYAPNYLSRAVVARVSSNPIRYERRLSDGSFEEYAQPDGALTSPRKVFLTRLVDATGAAVSFTYDESLRLVAVTDAAGQVTTLGYEHPTDPLKLTKVTDPFGRTAQFSYDAEGRLASITDVMGLVSSFEYGAGDFITKLRTPYGETGFAMWAQGTDRWIETTDALGGKERLEFRNYTSQVPGEAAPSGFSNEYLQYRNTFLWDKRAMEEYPGDYTKAQVLHWLHTVDESRASGTLEGERRALESRVWYAYSGQARPWDEGTAVQPTAVARLLDGGVSQIRRYEYNQRGMKVRETDPLGRQTLYVYGVGNVPDADPVNGHGLDLLLVKQKNAASPSGWDLEASYTYNANHQVLTATDAAGQTTTYTYTPTGQVETVTNAKSETTTYGYDTDGRLQTVTGPVSGTTTTYEYDGYGRLWRVTDPEGYATTSEYDVFDRPTKVTYPDGTWEETVYDRLDAAKRRDRLGRWTETFYDALRRPVATKDAEGRVVQQQYCNCGSAVEKLVDANGNATTWDRDLQGRVWTETRANGATYTYAYETKTSRLKTVTDPKGNVKTTSYNVDDTLAGITYTVAANTAPTPNVSFSYDPAYNRVAAMTDGTGMTTYAYYPVTDPPTLGAGKLESVDGPLANDTIEYGYDELGRVTSRQIGSPANTQTQAFDTLGRLETLTNPLGTFRYTYDGTTGRPSSLTYPNGQQTTWAHFDNLGDHRLQEIHNKRPSGATLSKFNYTYDAAGNILTWSQQADSDPPKVYELGYDNADQLTAAILKATVPAGQVLKRYYYSYDSAGNRTAEQIDDAVTGATYNDMNQLVSQQAGGALVFKGAVSEPATVTVGGKPATVTADNRFEGQAVVPGGTGQVAVTATDPSGNVRTNTYQVAQGATSKAFTYDANGNMTSDGTRTYEWDAENRLVAVKEGANTVAGYTYNKDGIRTSKTAAGVTTSYVLEGDSVVEERTATATTTHYQGPGIDDVLGSRDGSGAVTYLTRDHLGSIREHMNALGVVTLRRGYDPWGRLTEGTDAGGWAFTGRERDAETGFHYYRARYYDPSTGRFVSWDPVVQATPHLRPYSYVGNAPLRFGDPTGMVQVDPAFPEPCRSDLDRAIKILGRAAEARPACNCQYKDVGGSRDLKQLLAARDITIHYDPVQTSNLEAKGVAYTNPGDTHNIYYYPLGCRMGRWTLASFLAHELMHITLVPGEGQEGTAYGAQLTCGFPLFAIADTVVVTP